MFCSSTGTQGRCVCQDLRSIEVQDGCTTALWSEGIPLNPSEQLAKDGKGTLLSSCRCRMPCKRSIALFHCRTFSPHVAHKLVEEQAGNVWKGMERSCCGSNVSANCVPLLLPPSISLIFWTRSCPGIIGISWNTPGPVMAQWQAPMALPRRRKVIDSARSAKRLRAWDQPQLFWRGQP